MKLDIKHVAPYLPYGLKVVLNSNKIITKVLSLDVGKFKGQIRIETAFGSWGCSYYKLVLRPLSDLTKEIEHNGEKFVPIEFLAGRYNSECGEFLYRFKNNLSNIEDAPYTIIDKLLEWHFDVFGLIENGLAIDINILNKIE